MNDLVTHDKYGLGHVVLVEGDTAVVVNFSPMRVRITAPFARMTRLLAERLSAKALAGHRRPATAVAISRMVSVTWAR